ncbi:DUF2867 domain-containing protein [Streptomyces netropsis]|uniref:Polyketide cyclase / dehydrase and lipid transport n=1 Tax=Streptomyces netropsis TaxID=55404 RepID=A0A7W7LEP5_STRNE|nr:DUF2867 domain-containing protein [Streptomyces netropsis]MBB4888328.1 hypothetical protein [Streptomyces netropsis]GGR30053.1 hypothetical protein GCM10010219_38700 [Streptomyces netropsis]
MKTQPAPQVRQIEATDPIATAQRYDYADAFELRLPEPDPHRPEAWVRAGMDSTPKWAERIVGLLGMRRAPTESADRIGGLRVVESSPEMIHLETSLPLMRVVLVGRRTEPTRRTFTTVLHFRRPVLARIVWAVVGIGHRRVARKLITSKISND